MIGVVVILICCAVQIAAVATMKGHERQFYGSLTMINLKMVILLIVMIAVPQA